MLWYIISHSIMVIPGTVTPSSADPEHTFASGKLSLTIIFYFTNTISLR